MILAIYKANFHRSMSIKHCTQTWLVHCWISRHSAHMQRMKIQIRLCIHTALPGSMLLTYTKSGIFRMYSKEQKVLTSLLKTQTGLGFSYLHVGICLLSSVNLNCFQPPSIPSTGEILKGEKSYIVYKTHKGKPLNRLFQIEILYLNFKRPLGNISKQHINIFPDKSFEVFKKCITLLSGK